MEIESKAKERPEQEESDTLSQQALLDSASGPPLPRTEPKKPRLRLEFLDGLRGLTALYVVLYHFAAWDMEGLPESVRRVTHLVAHGHLAVNVFIVLSGYCLMLPVARSANQQIQGGFGEYLKRRMRRILPPYYAALAIAALLLFLLPNHAHLSRIMEPNAPDVRNAGNLLSHLFLVHNWNRAWVYSIVPPMWSVATEWQIYFLFPALLLPVWRRFGNSAVVLLGLAVGISPHFLFPAYNLDWACPWYIGLFAMGMVGAALEFSGSLTRTLRYYTGWAVPVILLIAAFALLPRLLAHYGVASGGTRWLEDIVEGALALIIVLYCARFAAHSTGKPRPFLLRILESPWAVKLGAFSYSIYLVHYIVLGEVYRVTSALNLRPAAAFGIRALIGIPIAILLSYLFHLAFERRFMTTAAPVQVKRA